MTQTQDKSRIVTLINVFTVDPANQHRLVDLLTCATDRFVRRAPGFISSTLHRSVDGTKVTMYAQWGSAEDYQAMRKDPAPLPFLEEALTIAKFEPGLYEIVRTFLPVGGIVSECGLGGPQMIRMCEATLRRPVEPGGVVRK